MSNSRAGLHAVTLLIPSQIDLSALPSLALTEVNATGLFVFDEEQVYLLIYSGTILQWKMTRSMPFNNCVFFQKRQLFSKINANQIHY